MATDDTLGIGNLRLGADVGVVVKAGIFPLLRCALILGDLDALIRLFGVLTAIFGVSYAVFEKDSKRMLAFQYYFAIRFYFSRPGSQWFLYPYPRFS
jgi:type IV secretory pathway TrbD component